MFFFLSSSFPNTNRNVFLYAWHAAAKCSMTTRRLGSEGDLRPSKQMHACYFLLLQDQIFGTRCSQFPRGSLEGVVVCASSSVWDKWKPFDFPSKERARAGRNCELCCAECTMPPTTRGKGGKRGGNINKTISAHYYTVQLSIFI